MDIESKYHDDLTYEQALRFMRNRYNARVLHLGQRADHHRPPLPKQPQPIYVPLRYPHFNGFEVAMWFALGLLIGSLF